MCTLDTCLIVSFITVPILLLVASGIIVNRHQIPSSPTFWKILAMMISLTLVVVAMSLLVGIRGYLSNSNTEYAIPGLIIVVVLALVESLLAYGLLILAHEHMEVTEVLTHEQYRTTSNTEHSANP